MIYLEQLAAWLQSFGPIGLFLAACLDSFVPLAHVVDSMVIVLSYSNGDPFTYALLATAGSVLGTTALFLLVRAGGQAFLVRRLPVARRQQLESLVRRNGLALIIGGGLMPPPFPLKALILAAGLARMRVLPFVGGLALSRSLRFGLEAILAVVYGDQALVLMREHYPVVALLLIAVMIAVWWLGRRVLGTPQPIAASDS